MCFHTALSLSLAPQHVSIYYTCSLSISFPWKQKDLQKEFLQNFGLNFAVWVAARAESWKTLPGQSCSWTRKGRSVKKKDVSCDCQPVEVDGDWAVWTHYKVQFCCLCLRFLHCTGLRPFLLPETFPEKKVSHSFQTTVLWVFLLLKSAIPRREAGTHQDR